MVARAQTISPEAGIEYKFLIRRMERDEEDFSVDIFRGGPLFLSKVPPRSQDAFSKTFDELVILGCCKRTLARSLYSFWRSRNDYPSSPLSQDVLKLYRTLSKVTSDVEIFNKSEAAELVRTQRYPNGLRGLPEVLELYKDILRVERYPRKDLVQSYGPIPCCLYAEIATGKFQFPLVVKLLVSLGYKPNPKRQMNANDKPQLRVEDIDEGDDFADSLERNYRNFLAKHPRFVERLKHDLIGEHSYVKADVEGGRYDYKRYRHYFDWKKTFPAQKVENRNRRK